MADSSSVKPRVAATIARVWVDKGYTGPTVADAAAKAKATVEIVYAPKPGHGFIVQPRRWVVEPTNGWINHCRRIDRHYETTLTAHDRPITPTYSDDSTATSCSTRFSRRMCAQCENVCRIFAVDARSALG